MVAAQRFNAAAGQPITPVYGAVTSGLSWRFMALEGARATVDAVEYPIQHAEPIYGILRFMALGV